MTIIHNANTVLVIDRSIDVLRPITPISETMRDHLKLTACGPMASIKKRKKQ